MADLSRANAHNGYIASSRERRAKGALPPQDRIWRASLAGLWRDRANQWNRHDANHPFARREGDHYVVSGQKIWTSRASTATCCSCWCELDETKRRAISKGLRVLLVDMRGVLGRGLCSPHPHHAQSRHPGLFFDEMRMPAMLIGEEGGLQIHS